jgi:hypothetical protein
VLREVAYQHRGEVVPGSGSPVEPRTIKTVAQVIGWECEHLNITAGGVAWLGRPSGVCDCEMRPVYA